MAGFDPYSQLVSFKMADGKGDVKISIRDIDEFNNESFSICINYGAQLGAIIIMLFLVLAMTPLNKYRRPSTILHILMLLICGTRMVLLVSFFLSPFNEFFNYWAADYSTVGFRYYQASIAGNIFSLLIVVIVEIALVNQAWAMVNLWPSYVKCVLSVISISVTLVTVGWRLAFTIILSKQVVSAYNLEATQLVSEWTIITNAISICWYCALFNAKLVLHLVANRSILPSYRSLTPMEVLVMTNGILMIIPVIFTGLEWGHWTRFEAASLVMTSVALLLPLGSLWAQRLSQSYGIFSDLSTGNSHTVFQSDANDSRRPLKAFNSYTSTNRSGTTPQVSISSRCETGMARRILDPDDVELARIDNCDVYQGHVRVDRGFEQREERL